MTEIHPLFQACEFWMVGFFRFWAHDETSVSSIQRELMAPGAVEPLDRVDFVRGV